MTNKNIFLGSTPLNHKNTKVEGGFVEIEDEKFYEISNYDKMDDFFMTIVSDSDHWMYISSNGSLTAGRKNRNNALFPYYSDDKIHDYNGKTGSRTIILAESHGKIFIWEPFSKDLNAVYRTENNLYKSIYGNKIIFEEINLDLGLSFRYGWYNSDKFGIIKKSKIEQIDTKCEKVEILDGIQNILPTGVYYEFQNEYSNLLDGYKKNELIKNVNLGLFSLSSIPVDRAEPSESLNATTVWSTSLNNSQILISNNQVELFRKGFEIKQETDIRAARGAYYVHSELDFISNKNYEWMFVAEVNQNTTAVANLFYFLKKEADFEKKINDDIKKGTSNLIRTVAASDGLQYSNEELCVARHFSNSMYNIMRGGVYLNNYNIEAADFKKFVKQTNSTVFEKQSMLLEQLPEKVDNLHLLKLANETKDANIIRICYEYLPITFSRRHGDPSRPWNVFSIDNKNEDGSPKSDFQGNWRDIFQNWEALSVSYPEFIENIISKFVNASTPDGYNPYRIMRNGIDWECPDPDDPWAYIGYWGDHQIIYLQKLLELSEKYHPGKLDSLLCENIFAYANVPYRIKPYKEIVNNPQDTILFDAKLNSEIVSKVEKIGADGRLLMDNENKIYHVNLTEKLLVSLLAKLSNFIPDAGIWLNTQRPEWNDANNALVGSGVSMVTLYYIRRFLKFWNAKFEKLQNEKIELSEEVYSLFESIFTTFTEHKSNLNEGFSALERKMITDKLGFAGENYRSKIYTNSFSGNRTNISVNELLDFTKLALEYIDKSIQNNRRNEGLYHAYNLISFTENGINIRYLYEMLEGQVAVLSSGYLNTQESLNVLDSLKNSKLFREDQYSYILYPDRELPLFVEKNNIPKEKAESLKLFAKLIEENDTSIISKDKKGNYHFNSSFRNAEFLKSALSELNNDIYDSVIEEEKQQILDIYEEMFDHQSFTGRSGTFFAYEGLGSIYWHMVSKLLLAVDECYFEAIRTNQPQELLDSLKQHYYEIKAGIGLYKSPELYGAFPIDAYSHTPANAGAKQPGLTGQVKEDVISRFDELGLRVINGKIEFDIALLNENEILKEKSTFYFFDVNGHEQSMPLNEKQLAFTFCQIPVIYTFSDKENIKIIFADGSVQEFSGNTINQEISSKIFKRTAKITKIEYTTQV